MFSQLNKSYYLLIILFVFIDSCNVLDSKKCLLESGIASWYGEDFHGSKTANGEIYDMESLTAAHKTLPFNTVVRVVNLDNGKFVTVRINNRGPFVEGRVIDLSRKAAREIEIIRSGITEVDLYLADGQDSSQEELSCIE